MKNMKKVLAVLLSVLMLLTAVAPTVFADMDESLLYGDTIITSQKEFRLISGIVGRDIVLNNQRNYGEQRNCFVLEVDLSNPDVSIIAGYNNGNVNEWKRSPVRNHANAAEALRGLDVIGAINADRYNTTTGEPAGLLVMDGVLCHPGNGRPYFAILNDGTPVIRAGNVSADDVKEGVSGFQMLVKDGKNVAPQNQLDPRTAIGLKEDGTVVMFVVDGRQDPSSIGMDYPELAQAMIALGCVNVLELDGGGSSTLLAQREGSEVLECRNSPSYGYERTVSSSLLVCTSAKPTGVFHHVSFDENVYMCSPRESVNINVAGADINGFAADLPRSGKLVLENDDFGSLSNGKFKSNGNNGMVQVNYVYRNEILGSATIYVTKDADSGAESLFKRIQQFFYNIINTFRLLIDKFNEKVLGKG